MVDMYDQHQAGCDGIGKGKAKDLDADEIAWLQKRRSDYVREVKMTGAGPVFMPSCFWHVLDERNWAELAVNGEFIGDAIMKWLENGDTTNYIDECEGFACNYACRADKNKNYLD